MYEQMSGRGVGAAIIDLLREASIARDPWERERFVELSSLDEVFKVALVLNGGEASTVEEARRSLAERDEAHERALEHRKGFRAI